MNYEISEEQKNIVNNLETYNIIVNAVAGSGKTTTILHIGLKYPDKKILLLTYNTRLRQETNIKIDENNINNIECHTYHSYFCKYYDACYKDSDMIKIINKKIETKNNTIYDIIIPDECQDMTFIYYKAILKIFKDNINRENSSICILGDERQNIFQFNNADSRFIKLAENIFNINKKEFIRCSLTMSYRLTNQMSSLLNDCMLKDIKINTCRDNNKVRYIIGNSYIPQNIENEIFYYKNMGYEWDDIFILAPSCRNKTPFIKISNYLKDKYKNKIPIYVSNDTEDISSLEKQDIINNKLVFTTFHQTKGLERKVVIVMNFDYSYFRFYARKEEKKTCPNILYVALTRSKEKMTLFHDSKFNIVPFINNKKFFNYIDLIDKYQYPTKNKLNNNNNKPTGVCDYLRYIPCELENEIVEMININIIKEKNTAININTTTNQSCLGYLSKEDVSDINGIIILAYYEYLKTKQMSIYNFLMETEYAFQLAHYNDLEDYLLKNKEINISNLLKLGNYYIAYRNKYNFKLHQIEDYNWLNKNDLEKCVKRCEEVFINNNILFETEIKNDKFIGVVDYMDEEFIYEIKATKDLTNNHILQLLLYAYIYNQNKKYRLFNILTGEILEISCDESVLNKIIDKLEQHKKKEEILINNHEFMEKITESKLLILNTL
jgi:hypothetical protein